MDYAVPEEPIYTNIRQTIRRVILPLVQAIYDENPSDVELFCADFFRDLLQNRQNALEKMRWYENQLESTILYKVNNILNILDYNNCGFTHKWISILKKGWYENQLESTILYKVNNILNILDYNNCGFTHKWISILKKDQQAPSYFAESSQKKEESMKYQYKSVECKETENFPTSAQGSASTPLLVRNKQAGIVNLRGTSSWDTPSKTVEPIKSLAVLEDAVCGIGDQLSPDENKIALANDAKAGDTATSLKDDSAFEDDSFNENQIVNEVKSDSTGEECFKPSDFGNGYTDEDIKSLCIRFEKLKTSRISATLKLDSSSYADSDPEIAQTKDTEICRKQLSPNSSFGFIPHLNEYESEEEMRKKHGEHLKTQIEEINLISKNISQTFHDLADEISCAETNFNVKLQNVEEISDVIQGQHNANATYLDNKSDRISDSGNDLSENKQNKIISSSLDKHDLEYIKDENNIIERKIKDLPFTSKVADGNKPGHFNCEEKGSKETKRDFTGPMDFHHGKNPDKDETEANFFDDDENDDDKSDQSEPQTTVDKSWRERWYEDHPSLGSMISSQRRYSRLRGAHFLAHRPIIGEAGDVPRGNFSTPNNLMNGRLKNQITSDPASGVRESKYSRSHSDEISHRSNGARVPDNKSERNASCEKISNANPQNIPYSWRKLCKQSNSSENVVPYSKESQIKLSEEIGDSSNSAREGGISSVNDGEATPETGINIPEEIFFEALDGIPDETNLGIKDSKVKKLSQYEDNTKEDVSVESLDDQITKFHDTQQQTVSTTDLSTNSSDKNQSKEYLYSHGGLICDQSANKKDTKTQNQKQCTNKGDIEIQKSFKSFDYSGGLDKIVNEPNDKSMKGEFGLNRAGGDFVSPINDANEQDIDSQAIVKESEYCQNTVMELDENTETLTQQNDGSNGGISMEYFGEVIESVIEQQKNDSKDSYDDLNFTVYSESDSSYIESSDFSETDDLSLNDSMKDK